MFKKPKAPTPVLLATRDQNKLFGGGMLKIIAKVLPENKIWR
jgi:hypothetical protein